MSLKHFFYWSLSLLLPLTASAQAEKWTHYFLKQTCYNLLIERSGNVWLGGGTGLIKYDGRSVTAFNGSNSPLVNDVVLDAAIDVYGNRWFVGQQGVSKFDGTNWHTYTKKNSGLRSNVVVKVAADSLGNVWFVTDTAGLFKFDGTTWTNYNQRNSPIPGRKFDAFYVEKQGTVWGGLYGSLYKYGTNNTWTIYTPTNSGLPLADIFQITADSIGNKWILTQTGLTKLTGSTCTNYTTNTLGDQLGSIAVDRSNHVWLTSYRDADTSSLLHKFDGTQWTYQSRLNYAPLAGAYLNLSKMVIDASNKKWIGASGKLFTFDGTQWTSISTSISPIPQSFLPTVLFADSLYVWMGSDNQGVIRFDGTNYVQFTTANSGLTSNKITTIAKSPQGVYWFGTYLGVCSLNGNVWTAYPTLNEVSPPLSGANVSSIGFDAQGKVWMYAKFRLLTLNGTTWRSYATLSSQDIVSMHQGRNGTMWVNKQDSLLSYNSTTMAKINLPRPAWLLTANSVYCGDVDTSNHVWMGGNLGIVKFDGSQWTRFPVTYGPASSIAVDKAQHVWATLGLSRLTRFNRQNWYTYTSMNSPALPNSSLKVAATPQGDMWVLGWDGLSKITKCNLNASMLAVGTTCGRSNGRIIVQTSGSNSPMLYRLGDNARQIEPVFNNLAAGTHQVTVMDTSGCANTQMVTVDTGATLPIVPQIVVQPSVCGLANGSLTVRATGQQLRYSLNNIHYQSSPIFESLPVGTYRLFVTDLAGCDTSVQTFSIQNGTAQIQQILFQPETCRRSNGYFTVQATSSLSSLTYSMDSIRFQSSPTFSNLRAGTYRFYVRDSVGCVVRSAPQILDNAEPIIRQVFTQQATCNLSNGRLEVSALGIQLQYSLDSVRYQSNPIFTGLRAGAYRIFVQDANRCTMTTTAEVVQPTPPRIERITSTPATNAQLNGRLVVEVTGGLAPLQYSLDSVTYRWNGYFENLNAGPYRIYVRDGNNCILTRQDSVAGTRIVIFVSDPLLEIGASSGRIEPRDPVFTQGYQVSKSGLTSFRLYPNPTDGLLEISFTTRSMTSVMVTIVNLMGQEVFQQDFEANAGVNRVPLKVHELIPGTYFLKIADGATLQMKPFTKW